jgi:type III secretion protein J
MKAYGKILTAMNARKTNMVQWILLVLLAFCLIACEDRALLEELDQKQAFEVVAVLYKEGIFAEVEKDRGSRSAYRVSVEENRYHEAVALLNAKNLPSPSTQKFNDVIKPRSFLPESREMERLRLDYALSTELKDSLESLAELVQASVVVRQSYLLKENEAPSVSVVTRIKAGSDVDEDDIRSTVLGLAPGVSAENVHVTIEEQAEQGPVDLAGRLVNFAFGVRVASSDYDRLVSAIFLLVGIALLFGILVGYWLHFVRVKNTAPPVEFPELASGALRIEKTRRKDLLGVEKKELP